jgi:P-type E1-E2 ATPase
MKKIDIVARATPQIKQQVLRALQDADHFVAMAGGGVNDATAPKQSDVGVAMGLCGTDIAKESAAMVLLDVGQDAVVGLFPDWVHIFTIASQVLHIFSIRIGYYRDSTHGNHVLVQHYKE